MREAGDVCFADTFKDGTGVVEFLRHEDMKYAVKKLDDSRFRSHEVGALLCLYSIICSCKQVKSFIWFSAITDICKGMTTTDRKKLYNIIYIYVKQLPHAEDEIQKY